MTDETEPRTIEFGPGAAVLWLDPQDDGSFEVHVDVAVKDGEEFANTDMTPAQAAALAVYRCANWLVGGKPDQQKPKDESKIITLH